MTRAALRPVFAVVVMTTIGAVPVTVAGADVEYWYPQIQGGEHVTACVPFSGSIDDIWAALNQKFGLRCEYPNSPQFRVMGFLFRCGPDNSQLFFRTLADCESFKSTANAGKHANVDDYVPLNVKNRDRWIVAYDGCMNKAATPDNLSKIGLQWLADYCNCMAKKLSDSKDDQITAKIATRAAEECSGGKLSPEARDFVYGGMDYTLRKAKRKSAKPTSAPVAKPSGGSSAGAASRNSGDRTDRRAAGVIKKGDAYADVMAALREIPAQKTPYGDFLDVTYKDPSVLAYPDAGGTCTLHFDTGRLSKCSGCDSARFKCAQ